MSSGNTQVTGHDIALAFHEKKVRIWEEQAFNNEWQVGVSNDAQNLELFRLGFEGYLSLNQMVLS